MYMGDPQRVAAITPSCKNRAKPKSAEINTHWWETDHSCTQKRKLGKFYNYSE